ncbi:hypothetical protein COX97_01795 [Candidatus Pacearchaeota archaeon CG_4_10_14_0_2_um_filter_05_32_18]|nr:MAG: hypothetical protein AUJ62_01285 [Candidatus Pacearchaeota archaeon CG1_02_32_21]PIZ83050.1 MAG: hypothetical protein COX97_01795 [Candidatus Pacearchaeota archaeon CG_4_10_14_0_2_um_filter_05_32_18]
MASSVKFTSSRIGSNPGGRCYFSSDRLEFSGYVKYCVGSHVNGNSSFRADHQPVYEAMTFELARKFGLKTVDTFLITNLNKDVSFSAFKEHNEPDPSGRFFYFISRISQNPPCGNGNGDQTCCDVPETEHVYLDSLLIADIIGKKQNYIICPAISPQPVYLDLGCSFVHAHEGFIHHSHKLKLNERQLKKAKKRLQGKGIVGADNETIVSFDEIVEMPFSISLTCLNPWRLIPINHLIGHDESSEIQNHLISSLCENFKRYQEQGLVL